VKVNGRIKEDFMRTLALFIFLVILPCAFAQQWNQGTETTIQSPAKTTITSSTNDRATSSTQPLELIFISGDVIMDDGMPPPFGAVIERECGGTVVKEAVIDPTGRFSFQIGDPNRLGHVFPDASQALGQDPIERDSPLLNPNIPTQIANKLTTPLFTKLVGCELKVQLSGYRSTIIRLGGAPRTGIIETGTILLYPIARVKGTIVSSMNLLAPKTAKKALENAQKASKRKDLNEAEKFIKSAIEIYPGYAQAWLDLGQLYEERKLNQEAKNAYKKAIALDKLFVGPYISLAKLAANEGKWEDAADVSDQVLALDPINLPEGYYLSALAYFTLNKLDLAEKRARQGLRMDLENRLPSLNIVLADILAKKYDMEGSIAALKIYLKSWPDGPEAARVRLRIQENENMAKAAPVNAKLQ
jgi:hypothetical protein